MTEDRVTMNVSITATARDFLKKYRRNRGRVQQDVLGRLINVWARQPDRVKAAMEDAVDEGMELAYAEMLEALAIDLRARAKGDTEDEGLGADTTEGRVKPTKVKQRPSRK